MLLLMLLLLLRAYGIAAVRSHPAFDSAPLSLRSCPCCLLFTFCIALISSSSSSSCRHHFVPRCSCFSAPLLFLKGASCFSSFPQARRRLNPRPLFLWHVRRVFQANQHFPPPFAFASVQLPLHTQVPFALASDASDAFACVLFCAEAAGRAYRSCTDCNCHALRVKWSGLNRHPR